MYDAYMHTFYAHGAAVLARRVKPTADQRHAGAASAVQELPLVNANGQTIVVALGGNAILQPGQVGTFEEQLINIDTSCRRIARLVAGGHRVVLTHGNGPQVGNILIQNDLAAKLVPPMPMDVCGAETQGQIGYLLQQTLHNHLRRQRVDVPVVTLLTEVVVDESDPAFSSPSKPVGPFYAEARARALGIEQGWAMREDAGRGWRRVVPSPEPSQIVQLRAIQDLLADGALVVCGGGGGIPVIRHRDGSLHGIEAVIDKDLASARLAADLGADILLILTDVPAVYVGYGTPAQTALGRVTVSELAARQATGEFKAGSMGPKIDAAARFAAAGGRAVIASLLDVDGAVGGISGTQIVADDAERPD
jgi:carbamate kinase